MISKTFSIFAVLVTLYGLALVQRTLAVDFVDCGVGNIRHVLIEGCDDESGNRISLAYNSRGLCTIPRGRNLWFRAMFVPNANYQQVLTDLRAKMGFIERPIPGAVETNACTNYVKCPLVQSAPYWVNTTFSVPTSLPRMNVGVTLKLLSPIVGTQTAKIIACGQTKVQFT